MPGPRKKERDARYQQTLREHADKNRRVSIAEAAAKGIERVRLPEWANPLDHIKIDIVDGCPGPWGHLFAPFNRECNGRDPVDFLIAIGPMKIDILERAFLPYVGPLPTSDEYQKAVAQYDGVLHPPKAV